MLEMSQWIRDPGAGGILPGPGGSCGNVRALSWKATSSGCGRKARGKLQPELLILYHIPKAAAGEGKKELNITLEIPRQTFPSRTEFQPAPPGALDSPRALLAPGRAIPASKEWILQPREKKTKQTTTTKNPLKWFFPQKSPGQSCPFSLPWVGFSSSCFQSSCGPK